jgi:hypothetical protein
MNTKNNKRSARVSSKKVTTSNHAKAPGPVPVVKCLRKAGMLGLMKETVDHERVANALYDPVDAVFLTAIAPIGGVRALSSIATVWANGVLRRLAGWKQCALLLFTYPNDFTSHSCIMFLRCFLYLIDGVHRRIFMNHN